MCHRYCRRHCQHYDITHLSGVWGESYEVLSSRSEQVPHISFYFLDLSPFMRCFPRHEWFVLEFVGCPNASCRISGQERSRTLRRVPAFLMLSRKSPRKTGFTVYPLRRTMGITRRLFQSRRNLCPDSRIQARITAKMFATTNQYISPRIMALLLQCSQKSSTG